MAVAGQRGVGGHEWVEIGRFRGPTKAYRDASLKVAGQVRARYEFDFESIEPYSYGKLALAESKDGDCVSLISSGRQLSDQQGFEYFGYRKGGVCANFHPSPPHWDLGTLSIVIEELR